MNHSIIFYVLLFSFLIAIIIMVSLNYTHIVKNNKLCDKNHNGDDDGDSDSDDSGGRLFDDLIHKLIVFQKLIDAGRFFKNVLLSEGGLNLFAIIMGTFPKSWMMESNTRFFNVAGPSSGCTYYTTPIPPGHKLRLRPRKGQSTIFDHEDPRLYYQGLQFYNIEGDPYISGDTKDYWYPNGPEPKNGLVVQAPSDQSIYAVFRVYGAKEIEWNLEIYLPLVEKQIGLIGWTEMPITDQKQREKISNLAERIIGSSVAELAEQPAEEANFDFHCPQEYGGWFPNTRSAYCVYITPKTGGTRVTGMMPRKEDGIVYVDLSIINFATTATVIGYSPEDLGGFGNPIDLFIPSIDLPNGEGDGPFVLVCRLIDTIRDQKEVLYELIHGEINGGYIRIDFDT